MTETSVNTGSEQAIEANSSDSDLDSYDHAKDADYVGEPKTVAQDFTYTGHTDQNRLKDPHGVYLDDEQRRAAEIQRARVEGREPDLEDPPATQGTPLVPTHVAQSNLPGDFEIPVDKQLPVVIGTPDGEVQEVKEEEEPAKEEEPVDVTPSTEPSPVGTSATPATSSAPATQGFTVR